jgi:hypothetical protein
LKANTVNKDKILADSSDSSSDEAFQDVKARVEKEKKINRAATAAPQHFSKNVADIMKVNKEKKKAFSSDDSDTSSDDSAFDLTENQRKKVLEDSDEDSDGKNEMTFDNEIKPKTLLYTRKETIKAKKTTQQTKEMLEKQDIL